MCSTQTNQKTQNAGKQPATTMDSSIRHTEQYLVNKEEAEMVWLALVVATMTTWTLMVISWAHHNLTTRSTMKRPILRTAGLSALDTARARRVHKTCLPCNKVRPVQGSSCGCITATTQGPVNFYVNYNCTSYKTTATTSTPKVRVPPQTDCQHKNLSQHSSASKRNSTLSDKSRNCVAFTSTPNENAPSHKNPAGMKFSSYEIVSLSEIRSNDLA